eukprot:CAMPEP_0113844854 /NCGR_PEP_ID=MMETSP0372-20130328/450_1 /TAXON_ID=340204 /ORGANISM="Lankesteria abbotti" /LENGTH=106 /DNA_ID=CAMNT_0000813867 /DNA_START=504 /DNA_END=824 /DNA_ORIENTATION=- /assembly_acc=CAM_ASM_000359
MVEELEKRMMEKEASSLEKGDPLLILRVGDETRLPISVPTTTDKKMPWLSLMKLKRSYSLNPQEMKPFIDRLGPPLHADEYLDRFLPPLVMVGELPPAALRSPIEG